MTNRDDTSHMYWSWPKKDIYLFWGQRSRSNSDFKLFTVPHDISLSFWCSHMYSPHPKEDLYWFWGQNILFYWVRNLFIVLSYVFNKHYRTWKVREWRASPTPLSIVLISEQKRRGNGSRNVAAVARTSGIYCDAIYVGCRWRNTQDSHTRSSNGR